MSELGPHGAVRRELASPAIFNGVRIVPAEVELKHPDGSFSGSHPLSAELRSVPPEIRAFIPPRADAVWVRGRVQRIFGVVPPPEDMRVEKSFVEYAFAARLPAREDTPFECVDHYGKTALVFSSGSARPPESDCDLIARAFWQLLLADPRDVSDFVDEMVHPGACVTIDFGIQGGLPFVSEREPGQDD